MTQGNYQSGPTQMFIIFYGTKLHSYSCADGGSYIHTHNRISKMKTVTANQAKLNYQQQQQQQ
jgi:hypothetical protein